MLSILYVMWFVSNKLLAAVHLKEQKSEFLQNYAPSGDKRNCVRAHTHIHARLHELFITKGASAAYCAAQ